MLLHCCIHVLYHLYLRIASCIHVFYSWIHVLYPCIYIYSIMYPCMLYNYTLIMCTCIVSMYCIMYLCCVYMYMYPCILSVYQCILSMYPCSASMYLCIISKPSNIDPILRILDLSSPLHYTNEYIFLSQLRTFRVWVLLFVRSSPQKSQEIE